MHLPFTTHHSPFAICHLPGRLLGRGPVESNEKTAFAKKQISTTDTTDTTAKPRRETESCPLMQAAERAANKNQTARQLQGGTAKRKRKSEAATVQRNRPKQAAASSQQRAASSNNRNRRHPDTRTTSAEPGTAIKVLQFMGRLAGAQAPLAVPHRAQALQQRRRHRHRQLKFLAN